MKLVNVALLSSPAHVRSSKSSFSRSLGLMAFAGSTAAFRVGMSGNKKQSIIKTWGKEGICRSLPMIQVLSGSVCKLKSKQDLYSFMCFLCAP